MKQLNEFETLAEAQSYTYTDEKMVSPDMVLALLTQHDSTISLESASYTDTKAKGFMMALNGSVTEFNVMNSHPVGQAQQVILTHLVSIEAVTASFADSLIGYANQVKQPYKNAAQPEFDLAQPEELLLPDSTEQKIYTLSISTNPINTAQVQILQRYGASKEDLTEWHVVNQFNNVKYKQDTWRAQVPQCNHTVRELKVVSNQTVNMSIS